MCPTCSYHNINWQKNPVHLNIMLLFFIGSILIYRVLLSLCVVKATKSCVDFVLPKLFPHLDIVLDLLRDRK